MKLSGARSMLVLLVAGFVVLGGQSQRFTRSDIEYELDLPSSEWQAVSRVDVHDHIEFVF